jgi:hypothetical protein
MMAIMLVVLIGSAAMAVDLGWLYWQSVEIQHGADAAALSGVYYEPLLRTEAHSEALASAVENGYDNSAAGTTVEVLDFVDDPTAVGNDSQLRVTITHQVNTFFMKMFGLSDVDIQRTTVASYVPPMLMGSPDDTFGRDLANGWDPGFWASISTTYGPSSWGDRYTSACKDKTYVDSTYYGYGYGLTDVDGNDCVITSDFVQSTNPGLQTAAGGYLYGIQVEDGTTGLTVEVFDGPMFAQRRYGSGSNSDDWTGDYWPRPSSWSRYETFGPPDEDVTDDFITFYMLYGPDATPLITSDNELLCVVSYNAYNDAGSGQPADDDGGREQYYAWWDASWSEFSDIPSADLEKMWESMATKSSCGSLDRGPGIYPLRVMMQHNEPATCPGEYATGGCPYALNKYSLRVGSSTGSATISAMQNMSIFANDVVWSSTEFYLAKVEPKYAGKDLIVEFWDAGDFGGDPNSGDTVEVIAGNGDTLTCTWKEYDLDYDEADSGTGCTFNMETSGGGSKYDNRIVQFTIPIPDAYTCTGHACWFRVEYNYTGAAAIRDVTTWDAHIDGNPIRIVE